MTAPAAAASVSVSVDPARAFAAFTDEIDAWWVRGPINFFDSARAIAMRIEPGVGGRVLEVYDDEANDALELGRITVWEPGARLTFRSSVDDSTVDVRFEPDGRGTRVTVTQALRAEGGSMLAFWPRILRWLVPWCEGPARAREPREIARVGLAIHYADPAAAARWLAHAFGLGSWSGIPAVGEEPDWIELHHGNVSLMLLPTERDEGRHGPQALVPWVYVDDLDAHLARATAAGATVVSGIEQHGFRAYTAEDLEGRPWTFAQARPTMG